MTCSRTSYFDPKRTSCRSEGRAVWRPQVGQTQVQEAARRTGSQPAAQPARPCPLQRRHVRRGTCTDAADNAAAGPGSACCPHLRSTCPTCAAHPFRRSAWPQLYVTNTTSRTQLREGMCLHVIMLFRNACSARLQPTEHVSMLTSSWFPCAAVLRPVRPATPQPQPDVATVPEVRQGRRWGGHRGRSVSPEPRQQTVAAPQEPRTDPRSQAIIDLRRRAEEITQNAARPAARDEQADLQAALQVAFANHVPLQPSSLQKRRSAARPLPHKCCRSVH